MGRLVTHAALDAPLANRHAQSYAFVGGERGPAVKGPLQERDLSPARSWKAHGLTWLETAYLRSGLRGPQSASTFS
jgi:hypothetical protein